MFKFRHALVLVTLAAAGCGSLPGAETGSSLLALQGEDTANAQGPTKGKMRGGERGERGERGARGFFAFPGVELTAEQKTQVQAIMEKYKPAAPTEKPAEGDRQARHEALEAALTAEPFDAAALTAALTPPADAPERPQADPQLLVELRAVLTDEQRAAAIAKLNEAPEAKADSVSDRPDPAAAIAEKLSLTDDQKAKLEAVTAGRGERPDPSAHRQAMATFLETGDVSVLPTPGERPAPPVEAMVAFVASLDVEQRATLAEGPFLFGGKGGHGGPGGHGDKGGHGGPRR